MTQTSTFRPVAALLAAAFAFGLWAPTLSAPPAHASQTCAARTVALPVYA